MKLLAVIALIGLTATPALAGGPRVRFRQTHYEGYCYKNVEKYILVITTNMDNGLVDM